VSEEHPAGSDHRVEATGETVGEAKWQALRELERAAPGLDKSAVRFEVVSEGERGLLGVGYAPARVVASVAAEVVSVSTPPAISEGDESALAGELRELLTRIVTALRVDCQIDVVEDDEAVMGTLSGEDLGLLIGRHGQTIDAIQYLVNAAMYRGHAEERKEVVVDAAGYRARRRASLEALAVRSAERALADGGMVELDPMTAVERKVVHIRLKEFDGVETTSEGTEPNRFVVIRPVA
jgi:spoIIIJ-associated protein